MASSRTIHTLTEAWPHDSANFELQAFAATVADELPRLSPPALDRIEAQLQAELNRRQQPTEASSPRPLRIAGGVARRSAPVLRMMVPYAAAACLLLAAGVWLNGRTVTPVTPQQPAGTLITDQPPAWQPAAPEDPAHVSKPAPSDG